MNRWSWLFLLLAGCATPGSRWFKGETVTCDEVAAARLSLAERSEPLSAPVEGRLLMDSAFCEAELGTREKSEPLLTAALAKSAGLEAEAEAVRAALDGREGKLDEAAGHLDNAVLGGFDDLERVIGSPSFRSLLASPAHQRSLLALAAANTPLEPRVRRLAQVLGVEPVTPVVVGAHPSYGVGGFALWRGRVLESHYDADNDETVILLEELIPHAVSAEDDRASGLVWTVERGIGRTHSTEAELLPGEVPVELKPTGRFFGIRPRGFPRAWVEATDLEVVGRYLGRSPFVYRGETGEAPTLDVVQALPFEEELRPDQGSEER